MQKKKKNKPYHSLNVDERIAQGDKVLFILLGTVYIVSFKKFIFIHPRLKKKKKGKQRKFDLLKVLFYSE